MTFGHSDTNFVFSRGKLTTLLDGGAGSSGKGKLGAFITSHADNWQFCCNAFAPQAGHWVRNDGGTDYFYQTLNSCAWQPHYEKIYIGPGAIIELPALWRELEENKVDPRRIGISPVAAILQEKDAQFERGETDLDGIPLPTRGVGTMKKGSTCHGVGAALARRRLRRPDTKLARDVPELNPFLCDVPGEIMDRLDKGQAGLLEIAQGFQLSYLLPEFFPFCTSRNCSVAAGFDDMMLPPIYAGNVVINFRTFPIRINNFKFIAQDAHESTTSLGTMRLTKPGAHLTWAQVKEYDRLGLKYEKFEGNSGPGYPDSVETTWEQVTKDSGSDTDLTEITSVTKLPRRVFTFSRQNVIDAVRHNQTNGVTYLSVNFANYVDANLLGTRGKGWEACGNKLYEWCRCNIPSGPPCTLEFIGTGKYTDDFVLPRS